MADLPVQQWYSSELESSESDPVEMEIIGLPSNCGEARRFGIVNGLFSAFNVTLRFTAVILDITFKH